MTCCILRSTVLNKQAHTVKRANNTQAEQKERCRGLEARLHVHERRLSAELGRWKKEANRADEMSGKIGAAESERDAVVARCDNTTTERGSTTTLYGLQNIITPLVRVPVGGVLANVMVVYSIL